MTNGRKCRESGKNRGSEVIATGQRSCHRSSDTHDIGEYFALASEGYVNAAGVTNAIEAIRENGKKASQYEVLQASDGQYFFHLKAGNGEIIGHSQTYASKSNADRAVTNLIALIKSELIGSPAAVPAPPRSIANYPRLQQSLQALSDVAAGGARLAALDYAETVSAPATARCRPASVAEIATAYDDIADEVQNSGDVRVRPDLTQAVLDGGRADLVALLGSDTYNLCSATTDARTTTSAETFIISASQSGPRMVMSLGFVK